MIDIADTGSGKTHRDENFPVASVLIAPQHRAPIMAFYDFVRAADDISDHPTLKAQQKLDLLERLDQALMDRGPEEPVAQKLREECRARKLDPQHARDLITAFMRDVTYLRYRDWDDLIYYCRYSAMPVGRFVCDVHGENPEKVWPANDALCAALQVINHLLDDARLAMEVGAIQALAEKLVARLDVADPLADKVHAGKLGFAAAATQGALGALTRRALRPLRNLAGSPQ
jgi:hypothetical protein